MLRDVRDPLERGHRAGAISHPIELVERECIYHCRVVSVSTLITCQAREHEQ